MNNFFNLVRGIVMGGAEMIPGVSGANFALVMGIYDDYIIFLDKITDLGGNILGVVTRQKSLKDLKISFGKVPWLFGIFLFSGMFVASVLFSNAITSLLEDHAKFVYALFFGLVAGSIMVPFKEIKDVKITHLVVMFATFAVAFYIFGIKPTSYGTNPPTILLFIAGIIAVVGNVMPGISGPFLLLLVGLYDFIIGLLASVTTLQFDAEQIQKFAIFFAGQLVGLALFIKVLTWLLLRYRDMLLAFLVGLIAASLRITYPIFHGTPQNKQNASPFDFPISDLALIIFLAIVGFLIVILAGKLGADRAQVEKIIED